ncbi:MAG: nucleotidyltransferase domain-containing protein [Epsilonproteobacteria bacterium]|nr:nucleotidyltransferase domain-containing protein [Campylobacterota bacterium]
MDEKSFEELKAKIVERLKPLNPQKIILFGSYAYGTPHKDSDIDLYVVTNDDFMPQSWREKSRVYLNVANMLDDIMKKYPTDLIVHTKAMHKKFLELNSYFSRVIMNDGVVL